MEQQRDALVERLFEAVLGFNDLHMVYLGDRLGLYAALSELGAVTPAELAEASGTSERYVREWLEQQAVTGILEEDGGRFSLPAGHAEVLLDPDSLAYLAPFARMMVGIVRPVPRLVEAFRTGEGIPYSEYDADFLEGQAEMNRVQFVNLLASEWLPAMPDVHERLQADPPARIADVACGGGWSTIAMARAYPKATVEGYDLDEASIELARANAAAEGLDIRFEVRNAAEIEGEFDLVTVFEAIHDMSQPVEVLAALRGLGGTLLVVDERVADSFTAPGDDVERLMFGWSVLHCLPVGLAEQPSAATGTAMRVDTFRRYAQEAGFDSVEVLPIENDFWRFYRLR